MTTTEKPRCVLTSTAAAGLCHWCVGARAPRYTVLASEVDYAAKLGGGSSADAPRPLRNLILRVCERHLIFLQSSNRAPVELLAIDGYDSLDLDLSKPGDYISRQRGPHVPDIQSSPLLTAG